MFTKHLVFSNRGDLLVIFLIESIASECDDEVFYKKIAKSANKLS